jgi:hypothetical protein
MRTFREIFFRTVALLMAMRDGGKAGPTKQLEKSFGKKQGPARGVEIFAEQPFRNFTDLGFRP